nr:hypothetical protein CFP56_64736 [Quercus suber]
MVLVSPKAKYEPEFSCAHHHRHYRLLGVSLHPPVYLTPIIFRERIGFGCQVTEAYRPTNVGTQIMGMCEMAQLFFVANVTFHSAHGVDPE